VVKEISTLIEEILTPGLLCLISRLTGQRTMRILTGRDVNIRASASFLFSRSADGDSNARSTWLAFPRKAFVRVFF
jgi:hypothetical protein